MTLIEAAKLAREALIGARAFLESDAPVEIWSLNDKAITALNQAIAEAEQQEPEFTKHEVENTYDWSEWVCPDPESYLMKCCDCGLVHEAQFKVVRYKFETEREDCEPVDDPNVQAVFRMRRSEQWSPDDTAHRAGGLPMDDEPAEQQEPVAWLPPDPPPECSTDAEKTAFAFGWFKALESQRLSTPPPQRKPLTDEQIAHATAPVFMGGEPSLTGIARAIEAAHGIKE